MVKRAGELLLVTQTIMSCASEPTSVPHDSKRNSLRTQFDHLVRHVREALSNIGSTRIVEGLEEPLGGGPK
jgi:hypothetical protein